MTLAQRIDQLRQAPQTVQRERELTRLQWELDKGYSRRHVAVVERAEILLDAFHKCGSMVVVLPDGTRFEDRPVHGGSDVQHFWNARQMALSLASMSLPYEDYGL